LWRKYGQPFYFYSESSLTRSIKYKHSSSWFCDDLIEYYINHRKEGEEIGLQKLLSTLNARKKASDGRWIVVPKIINDKGIHNSQVTATTQTFVKQTNNHNIAFLHRTMIARWHSKLLNIIPIERELVVVLVICSYSHIH
jgi:hypothetical protein